MQPGIGLYVRRQEIIEVGLAGGTNRASDGKLGEREQQHKAECDPL
jgi:hypothetical protein